MTRLVRAGLLIGAGLGGFVDGIVLHQLLQWHNMLSARLPPDTLPRVKANMVWDGWFHAGVWLLTLAGIVLLAQCAKELATPGAPRRLLGAGLMGWGLFNLVEGVVNHHVLGLHHVVEYGPHLGPDLAFLALGALLLLGGWWLSRDRASPAHVESVGR